MNLSVLFVDDEVNILNGIKRNLRNKVMDWDLVFVTNGQDALDHLASRPFDVIVSDMIMPKMSGQELLGHVQKRFPTVARIVLSGQCDEETAFQLVGSDHLYLAKPCSADLLVSTIRNAYYVYKDFDDDVQVGDLKTALCDLVRVMLLRGAITFDDIPEDILKWLPASTINTFAPYKGHVNDFMQRYSDSAHMSDPNKPYNWSDFLDHK